MNLEAVLISGKPGSPMQPLETANIVTNLGIQGDRKAKPGHPRQVLAMSADDVEHFGLNPGDSRENLVISGLDVMALQPGDRLRLGESAVIEATFSCNSCHSLDEVRQGLQEEMHGRRGMLFRVLEGGVVQPGDKVSLLR